MPIATGVVGFVVMFLFGAMTGHLSTVPKQLGKTIVTERGSHVRFYDLVDRKLVGPMSPMSEISETKVECVCKEK